MRDAKWRIREALARRFVDALKAEGIRGPEGSLACLTMREWGLHWSTIPEHTPARRYSGRACDVAQRRLMMRTLKAGLVAGCLVSFCGAARSEERRVGKECRAWGRVEWRRSTEWRGVSERRC